MTGWFFTLHALEQMAERGIARDELESVLANPDVTVPDPKGEPDCRYLKRRGVLAVVNEATRTVITVGVVGAAHHDWRTHGAPKGQPLPAEPLRLRLRRRRRHKEECAAPVQTTGVLDGVHPGIAAQVRQQLAELGLDFRAVRVLSPTEVTIDPPRGTVVP